MVGSQESWNWTCPEGCAPSGLIKGINIAASQPRGAAVRSFASADSGCFLTLQLGALPPQAQIVLEIHIKRDL